MIEYKMSLDLKHNAFSFDWQSDDGRGSGGTGIFSPATTVGEPETPQARVRKAAIFYTQLALVEKLEPYLVVAAAGKNWQAIKSNLRSDLVGAQASFRSGADDMATLKDLHKQIDEQIAAAHAEELDPVRRFLAPHF